MILTKGRTSQGIKDNLGTEIIEKGAKFKKEVLANIDYSSIQLSKWTSDVKKNELISKLIMNYLKKFNIMDAELKRKKFVITIGDELPSGIIQMAKVYVAKKRKISVGDKMAGTTRKQRYRFQDCTPGRHAVPCRRNTCGHSYLTRSACLRV